MPVPKGRWQVVAPSRFAWEQEALDYLRDSLGDQVLRAWSNFEFMDLQGSIYEVDLLLLTRARFLMVEIKSWSGKLRGDSHSWSLDGTHPVDNPLYLTNSKCKSLLSLLRGQEACAKLHKLPFLEPAVFLSSQSLKVDLTLPPGAMVFQRADFVRFVDEDARSCTQPIPPAIEAALVKGLGQAGIRRPNRAFKVGDYRIEDLLSEGPGYQDHLARHVAVKDSLRRVRTYLVAQAGSKEERERAARAAQREFRLVEGLTHPGILRPLHTQEHEYGPALFFDWFPEAERLDQYLALRGEGLDLWTRLRLVRQLAEILAYAHGRRLIHRGLAPQNVLVLNPKSAQPELRVMNWQTGQTLEGTSGTVHVQELMEVPATAYVAPEAMRHPDGAGEYSDVFSLGAVTFHILTGRPPARTHLELFQALLGKPGLRMSAVADGLPPLLDDVVENATCPDVGKRLGSVDEFLEFLADVERSLRDEPDEAPAVSPLEAVPNDRLPGGFTMVRRLGEGSTAVGLLAVREGQEFVLKVARDASQNQRLVEEAEVLAKLDHPRIVALHERIEMAGLVVLVLTRASERTLARRLREEGPLHLEFLQRWGTELLEAVHHLETVGLAHRDIKPGNLGVVKLPPDDALHLVLFDFSLSRVPPEQVQAGTAGYLDPFLRCRPHPRWDVQAERYAAAVTLYEMAAGVLPRWGDGRSDPALVECDLDLEVERFDASIRSNLDGFFRRALHRRPDQRFDNAEEMRAAWKAVFAGAYRVEPDPEAASRDRSSLVEAATLETPVTALGFSPLAVGSLDRLHVLKVRDLLTIPGSVVVFLRGVGSRTRREILEVMEALQARFPEVDVDTDQPHGRDVHAVDLVVQELVHAGEEVKIPEAFTHAFLGSNGEHAGPAWPELSELGARFRKDPLALERDLGALRRAWRTHVALREVRSDVEGLLRSHGGVMTDQELAEAILSSRGALSNDPSRRLRLAAAVLRAALEVEEYEKESRFLWRRRGDAVLVSLDEDRVAWAELLGTEADRLAAEDPLLPSFRAVEILRELDASEGSGLLPAHRLLRLAAACSSTAAVSSRDELYPRGMEARRALLLSHGALLGERNWSVQALHDRVASRYPEAEPLPGRPELDTLLQDLGWDLVWSAVEGHYERRDSGLSTSGTALDRRSTAAGAPPPPSKPVVDAQRFEDRLQASHRNGGFLALMTVPQHLEDAEREITRRFEVERVSVDALLIDAMQAEAARARVNWDVVLRADAEPGTPAWTRLLMLVARALPAVEADLLGRRGFLLLVHAGLLARYESMEVLERLRDRVGGREAPRGAWLLLATDEQSDLPRLENRPVPVLGHTQHARVPKPWLENRHRSASPS